MDWTDEANTRMLNPELYTGSCSLVLNILSLPKHTCIIDISKTDSRVLKYITWRAMKLCHCCCRNTQCRHSLGNLAHNAINSEFYILIVAMGCCLFATSAQSGCTLQKRKWICFLEVAKKNELALVSTSSPAEKAARRWYDHTDLLSIMGCCSTPGSCVSNLNLIFSQSGLFCQEWWKYVDCENS